MKKTYQTPQIRTILLQQKYHLMNGSDGLREVEGISITPTVESTSAGSTTIYDKGQGFGTNRSRDINWFDD